MGNIWLVIVAPVAVLAAIVMFMFYDQNRADTKATQAEQRRDRAEFDKDFAKAVGGQPNAELEARAAEANKQLQAIRDAEKVEDAARKQQRDSLAKEMATALGTRDPPAPKK